MKDINKIFQDLYSLDPAFREYEDELMKIIEHILESKPDTKFDKAFARELRAKLLKSELRQTHKDNIWEKIINIIKHMTNMYKYAGAVGMVVLVVAVGAYTWQTKDAKLAFAPEIIRVSSNAFGSLAAQDGKGTDTAQERAAADEAMNQAETLEIGAETAKIAAPSIAAPMAGRGGGGGGGSAESRIAPYPYNDFSFKYVGEEFALEDATVSVMRRITGAQSSGSIVSQVKGTNWGLVNLASLSQAQVENISIKEDREFGYYVNINFADGSINISENWMKWPNQYQLCGNDISCIENSRLNLGDIPIDGELTDIADRFLAEYGISTEAFARPEVNKEWRQWYDQAIARGEEGYIPDQVQVIYPLLIGGEAVYDQSGNKTGLNVNVNVRYRRAAGVWNLRSLQYESSDYEAITSVKDVIELVEQGGMGYYYESKDGSKELQIGAPERILMQTYNYEDGQSNELLVPALKFPILNLDGDVNYWRKNIIVPLAKELFERQLPTPRLLIEPLPVEGVKTMESAETVLPPVNDVIGEPEGASIEGAPAPQVEPPFVSE